MGSDVSMDNYRRQMARSILERLERIYVFQAPTGECKIGVSCNPQKRLQTLNGAMPRGGVRLVYQSGRTEFAYLIEKRIHAVLKDRRLNGEWFDISPEEAMAAIAGIDTKEMALQLRPDVRVRSGYRFQSA